MPEARAIHRYVNSSPRKMRLVVDLIRGKAADEALNILHFSTKHGAKVAEKVLRSAISNLQAQDKSGRVETDDMFVKTAFVNGGPSLKRMLPAPMGRAYRMLKRSNHITIIVAQREQVARPKAKPAAKKAPKTTNQE
jgi:large subunit ribosomal protein L22